MAFTIGLRIAVCALALMAQTLAQEVPTTEDMQMHSNFTADGEVADAIIFEAAANNPDNIKLLLRTHDPNAENKFGETALHLAAMHFTVGDIRTAEILLEAGADPDKMTHGKIDGHKVGPFTQPPPQLAPLHGRFLPLSGCAEAYLHACGCCNQRHARSRVCGARKSVSRHVFDTPSPIPVAPVLLFARVPRAIRSSSARR